MSQAYDAYTAQDHATWAFLMKRTNQYLRKVNASFLEGLDYLQLPVDRIPSFEELNAKLVPATGWKYVAADMHVSMEAFMAALSRKEFCSSIAIRPQDELDFCKLPDIFHDVFGHAAMLADADFCSFLEQLGLLSVKHGHNGEVLRFLSNIYWYTAEVGLVMENDELKYYGGSIISSISEIDRVYSTVSKKCAFNLEQVGNTAYDSYAVNDVYYTVNNLAVLNDSLPALLQLLKNQMATQA